MSEIESRWGSKGRPEPFATGQRDRIGQPVRLMKSGPHAGPIRLHSIQAVALGVTVDIHHLRYFVAVAERLNFTRAAEDLNMATSPLSRRIRDLERRLQVPLFDRTPGDVSLTSHGRKLLPLAKEALRRFDMIAEEMRQGTPQELNLGVATTTPPALINAAEAAIQRHYPNLAVVVECDSYINLQRGLELGRNDLAFQFGPVAGTQALGGVPMLKWHSALILRKEDPLADKQVLEIADLASKPFMLTEAVGTAARSVRSSLERAGLTRFAYCADLMRIAFEVSTGRAYSLGFIESTSPIAKIYDAFGLTARPLAGVQQTYTTWLGWSRARARQEPFLQEMATAVFTELASANLLDFDSGDLEASNAIAVTD